MDHSSGMKAGQRRPSTMYLSQMKDGTVVESKEYILPKVGWQSNVRNVFGCSLNIAMFLYPEKRPGGSDDFISLHNSASSTPENNPLSLSSSISIPISSSIPTSSLHLSAQAAVWFSGDVPYTCWQPSCCWINAAGHQVRSCRPGTQCSNRHLMILNTHQHHRSSKLLQLTEPCFHMELATVCVYVEVMWSNLMVETLCCAAPCEEDQTGTGDGATRDQVVCMELGWPERTCCTLGCWMCSALRKFTKYFEQSKN